MAQSKEFVDGSHALKELSHDLVLLESKNASLQGAVEGFSTENAKLRELITDMWRFTGTACKKYPRLFDPVAQGGQMVQPNSIDLFEQRIRELGIGTDK